MVTDTTLKKSNERNTYCNGRFIILKRKKIAVTDVTVIVTDGTQNVTDVSKF